MRKLRNRTALQVPAICDEPKHPCIAHGHRIEEQASGLLMCTECGDLWRNQINKIAVFDAPPPPPDDFLYDEPTGPSGAAFWTVGTLFFAMAVGMVYTFYALSR